MIRKISARDKQNFCALAQQFYSSDAVFNSVPLQHHIDAFDEMMRSDAYLEGYMLEYENNTKPVGYAITAKTYSHEAGGIVLWLEELFIVSEFRSRGLGQELINHIKDNLDVSVRRLRLEVEPDNKRADKLYQSLGFTELGYKQMAMEIPLS